ncbi:hypothetical protein [Acidiferrobacter sp.]|uniref:hypothetical protein n=1 Tax=Acidiferrobacter sp. TaxID=1872107 RepID=UPI002636FBB7|nr:hypothetical protein [Acidiferrobacter sp.]
MTTRRSSRVWKKAALALRLAGLHVRSQRMKYKLRALGRRQLTLTQEIAWLETRRQTPTPPARAGRTALSDARADPIWIHAPWRAGSTYVWNKFRSHPRYLAFYEPFHEILETLTPATIETTTATSWPSGHPRLAAPYYREYESLLVQGGGVRGFAHTFPYTYYFANDEPLSRQQAYLNGLVAHARALGRRPVFGFCRSTGRAAWFARYMPGTHIALTRDGLGLWRSAFSRSRALGDMYFITRPLIILLMSRRDPWIADYLASLDLDPVARLCDLGRAEHEAERLATRDPALTMRAFAAVFALGTALSQRHADIVVPIEGLSTEAGRRALTASLAGRFDIALDWSDCAIPIYQARPDDKPFLAHWHEALCRAEACVSNVVTPAQRPAHNGRAARQTVFKGEYGAPTPEDRTAGQRAPQAGHTLSKGA